MVHYLRLVLKSNFIEYVELMDYPHVAGEAMLRWVVLVVGAHPVPPTISDEDISTTDITIPPILIQGPITRSRAHQLKQQMNSFLCSSSCENENRLLPNDVLVLRNLGEDQQGLGKSRGIEEEQLGRPHRAGAQAQLDFDSSSESRSRPHQN